jgi:hypothetical protein
MLGILKDCIHPGIVMHPLDKCKLIVPGTAFVDPIDVAVSNRDDFSLALLAEFHIIVLQHHLLQQYRLRYLISLPVNYVQMLFAADCQLFLMYLSNASIFKVISPLDCLDV